MADKKISALTAATAVAAADYVHIVTDVATTPVNKRITGTYFFKNMFVDGNSATPIVVAVGAIDVTTPISYLSITGTKAYTLAAGNQGQIKVLICTAVAGTPIGTVTPVASANDGYNTIIFNAVGETAVLMYANAGWYILSLGGTSAALAAGTGPIAA